MTQAQRSVAQFQRFIELLPELIHIPVGGHSDERQIDGNDALIEAAVILVLSGDVVLRVGDIAKLITEPVRGQERAAAHARINIALIAEHDFLADVVRNHALHRALGRYLRQPPILRTGHAVVILQEVQQLRERRGDPDAILILHALITLTADFLADSCKVISQQLVIAAFIEAHSHRNERSLTVGRHERDDLILDDLDALLDVLLYAVLGDAFHLLVRKCEARLLQFRSNLLAEANAALIDELGQMRQRNGLAAVLA